MPHALLLTVALAAAPDPSGADLVIQVGHRGITALAASGDGRWIATGARDGTAKLWSAESGLEVRTFEAGAAPIGQLELAADGRWLLAGAQDGAFEVRDTTSGARVHASKSPASSLHPTRPRIAAVEGPSEIAVANFSTGAVSARLRATGRPRYSPDGRWLALLEPGAIRVHDAESLARVRDIAAPGLAEGAPFAFSADGTRLAAFARGAVVVFEVHSGRALVTLDGPRPAAIALSPQGDRAAIAREDQVELAVVKTGARIAIPHARAAGVAFGAGGRLFTAGPSDPEPRAWNAETGAELPRPLRRALPMLDVDVTPDGKSFAVANGESARVFSLVTGELLHAIPRPATAVAFGGNGSLLALAAEGRRELVLVSLPSRAERTIELPGIHRTRDGEKPLAVSPDGRWVAVFSEADLARSRSPLQLSVFDARTGAPAASLPLYNTCAYASFSEDSATLWLVVLDPGGAPVRAFETRRWTEKKDGGGGTSPKAGALAVARGGTLMAEVKPAQVILHTPGESEEPEQKLLMSKPPPQWAAFGHDGTRLHVTRGWHAGDEMLFESIDLSTGRAACRFEGQGKVNAFAVGRDGRHVVSAGDDATARVWDARTCREVVRVLAVGADDFVTVTPDHLFRASKGALPAVGFRDGREIFSFEHHDLRLERPDVVLERLGRAPEALADVYRRVRARRIARLGLDPRAVESGERAVPIVELVGAPPPASTTTASVSFTVAASDALRPLSRLFVNAGGVPLGGAAGRPIPAKLGQVVSATVSVPLEPGANRIHVTVMNASGVESAPVELAVFCGAPKAPPDLWIALLGVSRYRDRSRNLPFAAQDAADLVAAVKRSRRFGKVHVKLLRDQEVTRETLSALREHFSRARVSDVVVLFAAGHAVLDGARDYFLATHDTTFAAPTERAIAFDELGAVLDGARARRRHLLLELPRGQVPPDLFYDLRRNTGTQVELFEVRPGEGEKNHRWAALP